MPSYAQVPLPQSDGPEAVIAGIADWIGSEPVRDLAAAFGGALPGGTAANLDYLEAFSAAHWDFRAGRERFETGAERFDPSTERLVREAALALGLGGEPKPGRQHYTHVLILGGLVSSCLFRTRFAADLLADSVAAEQVTGVGGFRPFNHRDREFAELTGVAAGRFEVDAMAAGLELAFEPKGEPEVERGGDPDRDPNRAWKITAYTAEALTVRSVAAPSSEPEQRRADTADTCRFWADHVADLGTGDSVLVVTSSIFIPFQHGDALSYMGLPYGCEVDTVGVDTTTLPETYFRKEYTASGYLQEIRSAIRSMRRLHRVAAAV
ncbi:hypothetical protein [Glycomyces xiaoerkulensis]|uniref:hypothetical protein n=1 Tax=Glycomyces xiaoerkulensis TaxID=2038139 RepID=UPI000C25752F|nr:hypothetical protein [Glycomyces xiaoerkulensis]